MSGISPLSSYDAWKTSPPEPDPRATAAADDLAARLEPVGACDFTLDWSREGFDGALPPVIAARLERILIDPQNGVSPAEQVAEYMLEVLTHLVQQDGVEFSPELIEQISELHRLACLASK